MSSISAAGEDEVNKKRGGMFRSPKKALTQA